jgi:hypothetical protein
MAGNFLKYAGPLHWNDLPVDSHELIALCAPRPVFISSGDKGDGWVDAKGMFLAAAAAGPVYRLLGKKDLGTTEFQPTETTLIDGDVAFRQQRWTYAGTKLADIPDFRQPVHQVAAFADCEACGPVRLSPKGTDE